MSAVKDGLAEVIERHVPKCHETEICFFAESGSLLRIVGSDGDGMYTVLRQITFRCGLCAAPLSEQEIHKHFDHHAKMFGEAVAMEKKKKR